MGRDTVHVAGASQSQRELRGGARVFVPGPPKRAKSHSSCMLTSIWFVASAINTAAKQPTPLTVSEVTKDNVALGMPACFTHLPACAHVSSVALHQTCDSQTMSAASRIILTPVCQAAQTDVLPVERRQRRQVHSTSRALLTTRTQHGGFFVEGSRRHDTAICFPGPPCARFADIWCIIASYMDICNLILLTSFCQTRTP